MINIGVAINFLPENLKAYGLWDFDFGTGFGTGLWLFLFQNPAPARLSQ